MKLGEFFIDLVVNAGSGELTVKNLVTQMGELQVATVGEIGVLYEMGVRLAALTDTSIKAAIGLEAFQSHTGASTIKLQQWRAAAEIAHVSAETVTGAFESMSEGLESMKWGEPTGLLKGAVQILGIDPTGKDVFGVMDAISAKLREKYGRDQAAKVHILREIGMSPDMLRVLDMSAAERAKAAEGAYIMSQKQEKTFLEIEGAMIRIQRAGKTLGAEMAEMSAPTLLAALSAALVLIREIQRELKTGTGIVGLAKMVPEGWQRILELTGNKSLGEMFGKEFQGFADLEHQSKQTGWQSTVAALGMRALDPVGLLRGDFATAAPAAAGGSKTFHNAFSFPGVTHADEAKRAAHAIIKDQSDDTEWQLDRGATK